jgi:hypothetical protein
MIIDQTEALTTIDVNTGGFVGHRNLEDTIFRTNLEVAARAIARQLRLRNRRRHHHRRRLHRHAPTRSTADSVLQERSAQRCVDATARAPQVSYGSHLAGSRGD